jgi:hypothetical protein
MGAVAQGTLLRVLAGTEVNGAVRLGLIRHRREGGTLVGAIAERLVLAVSAGAPVVGLAGFDEDGDRGLLRDAGRAHDERV